MSVQEKRRISRKLDLALETLSPDHGPAPGPTPTPGPFPGDYSVSGSLERDSFFYSVRDAMDMAGQCVAQFNNSSYKSSADATVSVNFGTIQTIRNNSSYWRSAGEACAYVSAAAVRYGLPSDSSYDIRVVGAIERKTMMLQGFNLNDIMVQCLNFHADTNLSSVDDIVVLTRSGQVRVLRNNSSYWKSASEVCNQVMQAIQ